MLVTNLHLSSFILHPMYIVWNPSEVIGHLGPITLRWYGTFWLVGIVGAYFMVKWLYKDQKIKD
ncbi:MAG: hypothetical protein IKS94_04360, partial [Prevotella sp.]|nr:hypothetical protein [Prevotella sp.]